MRVGVICSAGGSPALEAAAICRGVEFFFITDRHCGTEVTCEKRSIPFQRVEAPSSSEFSSRVSDLLSSKRCDLVLMLFSRVVTQPLLTGQRLLNVHPSLLPAFPGLGSLAKAHKFGVKYFGATLHHATAEVDAGAIIAQACQVVPHGTPIDTLNHLSFLHRTALILLALDLAEAGQLCWEDGTPTLGGLLSWHDQLNPMLTNNHYIEALRRLQKHGPSFLR